MMTSIKIPVMIQDNMRVALCQLRPLVGDVVRNTDTIVDIVVDTDADLLIFPELFLTDYSYDGECDMDTLDVCLDRILQATTMTERTVIVGGPYLSEGRLFNSAYIISDIIERYDKINLPGFGVFSEKDRFSEGDELVMTDICGFRIGVIICYDIFFPELVKMYAMNGADAVVCISASPTTSKISFERVFPARSVESTVYMLFVNNIGERDGMTFFGGSRCLSPSGDTLMEMGDEENISFVELDHDSVDIARRNRPTLKDTKERTVHIVHHIPYSREE